MMKHRMQLRSRKQGGMGLIELMIAMFILAVGLIGVLALILTAMNNNSRSRSDTDASFVAELVIEQLGAQPAGSNNNITLTDCAGNVRTLYTTGAAAAAGAGATLYTSSTAPAPSVIHTIDWTQAQTSVPTGYQMYFSTCDAYGVRQTFDVRWNVIQDTTYGTMSKVYTVGVRPRAATTSEVRRFAIPISLRMVTTN